MGTAAVIASIGVALAGVGLGVWFVTKGFAALANAIKDLDTEKLKFMQSAMLGIGIAFGVLIAIMTGLAVSGVGTVAAAIMLAFGAALLMVGGAVAIASLGISKIISALGTLGGIDLTNLPTFSQLASFAAGLTTLSLASIVGLPGLWILEEMASYGPGLEMAGKGVKNLSTNIWGLSEALRSVTVDGGKFQELESVIGSLSSLMLQTQSTPIRVEVGGSVDGSVNVAIEGSDFKKDLLRDSYFLEELTSKIEQRVTLRDNTSGL
jgi:hypothetical protein